MASFTPPLRDPSRSVPPVGTRHKQRKRSSKHAPSQRPSLTPEELAARLKELEQLPDLIKKHYTHWDNGAAEHQLQGMRAQHMGEDFLCHAGTSSGKTGMAAGPYLLESNKKAKRVTLFVSPLLALHEEQVCALFGCLAKSPQSKS